MNTKLLSKKAIRLLGDNGYRFKKNRHIITFKRPFDYVSVIVVSVILLIVAGPMFIFNTFLGFLTIVLGLIGLFIRLRYYSKKMDFIVNLKTQKFDFQDNVIVLENQSLSYATKIILHSRFVSEYSSSFKNTSEEHEISIRIELKSGDILTLFKLHSDYAEPNEEIKEIYILIKRLIRWTKKKVAQSKLEVSESG